MGKIPIFGSSIFIQLQEMLHFRKNPWTTNQIVYGLHAMVDIIAKTLIFLLLLSALRPINYRIKVSLFKCDFDSPYFEIRVIMIHNEIE
jgi:hypothetical protein